MSELLDKAICGINDLQDEFYENNSEIKNMFGKLDPIDILAETKTGKVLMVLVCNGLIGGSPETQKALLDKTEGLLSANGRRQALSAA